MHAFSTIKFPVRPTGTIFTIHITDRYRYRFVAFGHHYKISYCSENLVQCLATSNDVANTTASLFDLAISHVLSIAQINDSE
jgi:hypothetical protein